MAHNRVTVPITAGEDVVVRGEIYAKGPGGQPGGELVNVYGPVLALDEVGRPKAELNPSFARNHTVVFERLSPNTEYDYRITAMNRTGKKAVLALAENGLEAVRTAPPPPAFGLNGAVEIRIQPTVGLIARWTTTVPSQSGLVHINFGNGFTAQQTATVVAGSPNKMEVTVPLEKLQGALASTAAADPVITISATGPGGETISIPFTFAIELPNERNAIQSVPVLNAEQKDRLDRVWARVKAGAGNIQWQDVGTMTLRLVKTVVLP
jgi:hypothetical protein